MRKLGFWSVENQLKGYILVASMGCKKLTYQNFSFLEVIHRKNATALKKNRLYGDHLGNIRLSYADTNNDGTITQNEIIKESNYYPFGLKHKGYNNVVSSNGNSVAQKFGFGGKELSEELGIQWMDFGARNYDAALGRWMNIDPLAEQMRRHSPYNYAFNNPLRFTDPDGMAPEDIIIKGSKTFRMKALGRLQALTNDQLKISSDGTVVITSLGTKNTGKTLTYGTNLIRDLNKKGVNEKTVTIVEASDGNYTATTADGYKKGTTVDANGNKGTGKGADSRVGFDVNDPIGGKDVNGNSKRPIEIGLGHELIHAQENKNGINDRTKSSVTDPDGYATPKKLRKGEVRTRKKENKLRKEHKLPNRKI